MHGALIRQARVERSLTQRQLADISGIEQSNISAIENDRRAPSAETLHRLLSACGFELVATAGARVLACQLDDDTGEEIFEAVPADVPIATKARMLVGALDAAEAIVRSR